MKSDENLLTCKVWHDNPQWLLFNSSFTEQLPDERLVSQVAFGKASGFRKITRKCRCSEASESSGPKAWRPGTHLSKGLPAARTTI